MVFTAKTIDGPLYVMFLVLIIIQKKRPQGYNRTIIVTAFCLNLSIKTRIDSKEKKTKFKNNDHYYFVELVIMHTKLKNDALLYYFFLF